MSFIRRNGETAPIYKEMFGGPGEAEMHRILLGADEMSGKGRLFNHIVLHPGCGFGWHCRYAVEQGAAFGWHVHDGDSETYYILRGEGEYNDNGTLLTVGAGDVTFVASGEGHSLRNTGEGDLEFIALILYK